MPFDIDFRQFVEFAKGMASVLGIFDAPDFTTIDPQKALTPRSNIHLQLVFPDGRDPLLKRGAFADRKIGICFLRRLC